jgi:ribonuclease P protein component
MMKRQFRLRSARDFAAVRTQGKAVHSAVLTLSWLATDKSANRYGFIAGKRVGNAVTRNLVKRRLRAIIQTRNTQIASDYDITIIARQGSAQRTFAEHVADIERLLKRARLWCPSRVGPDTRSVANHSVSSSDVDDLSAHPVE